MEIFPQNCILNSRSINVVQHFLLMICMLGNTFKINCASNRHTTYFSAAVIFLTLYLYNSNCLLSERICVWNVVTLHLLLFLYYSYLSILDFFFPLNDFFLLGDHEDPRGRISPLGRRRLRGGRNF